MFDAYTPKKPSPAPQYDFSQARPGVSIWFETNHQRIMAYKAFKRWKAEGNTALDARSVTVGDEDPRGPGFRLVFEVGEVKLKPNIKAALAVHDQLKGPSLAVLEYTGILSADDVFEALAYEGEMPTTLGHAGLFKRKLFKGETKYQLEFCAVAGKPTWQEAVEAAKQKYLEQGRSVISRQIAKPEVRQDPATIEQWRDLTTAERSALDAHGIRDFATFNEAWQTFAPMVPTEAIIEALCEGQGEWHAYRVRVGAIMRSGQAVDYTSSNEELENGS